jgi:16S rRNA (guanine527-N7)-methyltransferase
VSELPAAAEAQLERLLGLLVADPTAPTSLRTPERVRKDHLADSLVALELEAVRTARTIADVGSGPGLPGLALAIALPNAEVRLIESSLRKCRFLERAIGVCQVQNAAVVHARVEEYSEGLGCFELVTARAVAPLAVIAEYAAPLLKLGGAAVVWSGRRDRDAEAALGRAAAILGLELDPPLTVKPYAGAEHRHLRVMRKVAATPDRFPRRPGIARKRPLGGHNASDRVRR